jgi:hypothetical protein
LVTEPDRRVNVHARRARDKRSDATPIDDFSTEANRSALWQPLCFTGPLLCGRHLTEMTAQRIWVFCRGLWFA